MKEDLFTRDGAEAFLISIRERASSLTDKEIISLWMDVFHYQLHDESHPWKRDIIAELNKVLYDRFASRYRETKPDLTDAEVFSRLLMLALDLVKGTKNSIAEEPLCNAKFKLAATITEEQFRDAWENSDENVSKTAKVLGYAKRDSVYKWLKVLGIRE